MILFDYIYYLFACLYRKSKEERESDTWGMGGIAIVALTFCLFIMFLTILILHWSNHKVYLNPIAVIILIIISIIFFHIRYEKKIPFEKVRFRIKRLSITQMILLQLATFIYLLIAIPGFFIAAVYWGKSGQG